MLIEKQKSFATLLPFITTKSESWTEQQDTIERNLEDYLVFAICSSVMKERNSFRSEKPLFAKVSGCRYWCWQITSINGRFLECKPRLIVTCWVIPRRELRTVGFSTTDHF